MTKLDTVLVAIFALFAIAAAGLVVRQAGVIADVRTELTTTATTLKTTQDDLAKAQTAAATAEADRKRAADVLTQEREDAVAVEAEVARLKALIAKAPRTDAPDVKPVLKDTIARILKTGTTRQDALFNGRRPDVLRLVVLRNGGIVEIRTVKDAGACRDIAVTRAIELVGTPEAEGVRMRCEVLRPGESA